MQEMLRPLGIYILLVFCSSAEIILWSMLICSSYAGLARYKNVS
jgi:hypothetical protein